MFARVRVPTLVHVVIDTVLQWTTIGTLVVGSCPLGTRLEALCCQIHIFGIQLDLRVRLLLEHVVLAIVNLVQQVFVVDS